VVRVIKFDDALLFVREIVVARLRDVVDRRRRHVTGDLLYPLVRRLRPEGFVERGVDARPVLSCAAKVAKSRSTIQSGRPSASHRVR
jgi:hypothetical protein